jgi:ATP-binding cassette subfamily B protein
LTVAPADRAPRSGQGSKHLLPRVRDLAPFLGVSRWVLVALVGSAILAGFAEAAVLALIAYTASTLSGSASSVSLELSDLTVAEVGVPAVLAIAFGLALVRLALQEVGAYLPARLSADRQLTMRQELWTSFLDASWQVQSQEREGRLQELLSGQVLKATEAVLFVATGIAAGVTFAVLVLSALALNLFVAGLTVVLAGALFVALRPLTRLGRRLTHQHAVANLDYSGGISEGVRMAEEIQVFRTGDAEKQRTLELAERVSRPFFRAQLVGRSITPLYQGAALLIILAGLGALYAGGAARIATLGAIVLILIRALSYSQLVQSAYHALNESLPSVDLLKAARDKYAEAAVVDGDRPLASIDQLEFRSVSFAYIPDRDVLRGVSFAGSAREAHGHVRPSAVGKSTLVQLLLRLRSPTGGAILVNGGQIDALSRADWFRRVAYVPQDPQLMRASVRDNIRFFRPWIDDGDVQDVARRAHIHDEIVGLPHGYETIIGQRADAVSGGQRQRICLARALAGQPDMLVLDEPTSALDMRSEKLVQQSLLELQGTVTMLIVAHRLSTLNICDRTMVFADGRLEAFGSASELVNSNEYFRNAVSLTRVGGAQSFL